MIKMKARIAILITNIWLTWVFQGPRQVSGYIESSLGLKSDRTFNLVPKSDIPSLTLQPS